MRQSGEAADEHSGSMPSQISLPAARPGVVRPDQVGVPTSPTCRCAETPLCARSWTGILARSGWPFPTPWTPGSVWRLWSSHGDRQPRHFQHRSGIQFTSAEWTGRLLELGVSISMDGRGRWMDNVFIERLWRSVKYEEIYLREHATILVLRVGLDDWFTRYNTWRPHQRLGNRTPHAVYHAAHRALTGRWKAKPRRPHDTPQEDRDGFCKSSTPGSALHSATLRGVLRLPFRLTKSAAYPAAVPTSSLIPQL